MRWMEQEITEETEASADRSKEQIISGFLPVWPLTNLWLSRRARSGYKATHLRACLKTTRGPAARDFAGRQGLRRAQSSRGAAGASPPRAVTAEPTKAAGP